MFRRTPMDGALLFFAVYVVSEGSGRGELEQKIY